MWQRNGTNIIMGIIDIFEVLKKARKPLSYYDLMQRLDINYKSLCSNLAKLRRRDEIEIIFLKSKHPKGYKLVRYYKLKKMEE
jgi:hypothetical protein